MITLNDFYTIAHSFFSPDTSFQHVLAILAAVGSAAPLLYFHSLQRLQGNRRITAWLVSARKVVHETFVNTENLYTVEERERQPTNEQEEHFQQYLPEVAEMLNIGGSLEAQPLIPNVTGGESDALPRVLITNMTTCLFCVNGIGQPQKLHRQKDVIKVSLITRSHTHTIAYLAIAHCYKCGADYHPDRIVKRNGDDLRQFYIYNAQYLRISKPAMLWVDRTIAIAQAQAILQHQTFTGYASHFNKTYGPFGMSVNYDGLNDDQRPTLTPEQSYRMFVEHMVRVLGTSHAKPTVFHTKHDPVTAEVVREANSFFTSSGVLPGALEHTCAKCTHDKQYRTPRREPGAQNQAAQFGVAGVDERPPDLQPVEVADEDEEIARALAIEDAAVLPNERRPDMEVDGEERVVRMVVLDGIVAGHSLCNAPVEPPCKRSPSDFKSARFCTQHEGYNAICGIVGCRRAVAPKSKVCNAPAHLAYYAQYQKRFGRESLHAVKRTLARREEQRQSNANRAANNAIPLPQLPPQPELPEDDPALVNVERGQKVQHTFQASRTYCVEILTWACGHPLAADKFYVSESESQVYAFLSKVWPDHLSHLRPDYLAYDRACFILKHLTTSHPANTWTKATRFIVDAFHYIGHRVDDIVCRKRCNPAPTDGSQPDLVIETETEDGQTVRERAFNTEAAEQLNSWFDGFKGALNRMTQENFDFVVYCILFLFMEDWKYRAGEELRKEARKAQREAERAALLQQGPVDEPAD